MSDFNPDEFLAETQPAVNDSESFDPDGFLRDTEPATSSRLETLTKVATDKPDQAAKYNGLAKKAGVTYEVAKLQADEIEKQYSVPDWREFSSKAPKTASHLAGDPVAFQVLKNDVSLLGEIEQSRKPMDTTLEASKKSFQNLPVSMTRSLVGGVAAVDTMAHQLGRPDNVNATYVQNYKEQSDRMLDMILAEPDGAFKQSMLNRWFPDGLPHANGVISRSMASDQIGLKLAQHDYDNSQSSQDYKSRQQVALDMIDYQSDKLNKNKVVANSYTLPWLASSLIDMGAQVGSAAMAGLVAGPVGAAVGFAAPVVGSSFADAKQAGMDDGRALENTAVKTAAEVIPEMFGLAEINKAIKATSPMFQRVANASIANAGEEAVTTILNQVYDAARDGKRPDIPQSLAKLDVPEKLKVSLALLDQQLQDAIIGGFGGAGITATGAGAKAGYNAYIARLDKKRTEKTEKVNADHASLLGEVHKVESMQATHLDKDVVGNVLDSIDGEDKRNLYVDPAQLLNQEGLSRQQVEQLLPSSVSQLDQALSVGGLVSVPRNELIVHLAATKDLDNESIIRHFKEDATSDSKFEIEQAGIDSQIKQADMLIAKSADAEKLTTQRSEVYQQALDDLNKSGMFKGGNDKRASVWAAMATATAMRTGKTPMEMYKESFGRVTDQAAVGDVLNQQSIQSVKDEIAALGVDAQISEFGDIINLDKIVVPEDSRNQGKATAAMRKLLDYADASGKHIALSPSTDFGANKKRLREFYRRFGFVENKGKNKAFSTRETMHRQAVGKLLFQDRNNQATPRGTYDPSTRNINLTHNADLSTFLHESGHMFLDIMVDMSLTENASESLKKDMDATMRWFGIEGDTPEMRLYNWSGMSINEKRQFHEKWAESFEQYLFEGKAPSIELAHVFSTFRQWLLHVYKSISQFVSSHDGAKLNDEVRGVFDRMLATEQQIQEAEAARGLLPLFDKKPDNMTDAEWKVMQQAADDSARSAFDQMTARSLRDMKWLSNAKNKTLRKLQREADAQRRESRMEARRQIMSQGIYRAWQFLNAPVEGSKAANKKAKASAGVDASRDSLLTAIAKLGGLNMEQAVSQYGLDSKDFHHKGGIFGKPVLRKEGGLSPDAMGEALSQYGYLPLDEHGKWDIQDLEDKLREEAAGNPQYSDAADYDVLLGDSRYAEAPTSEEVDFVGGRLSRQAIREMYDDADLAGMQGEQADTEGKLLQEEKYKPDLFVAHNLTAENLVHSDELGGLAAPSLGVSRTTTGGFTGFGEITLLADKSILTDRDARTFDADVYSPRHPRAQENISYGNYIDLVQRIKASQGEVEGLEFRVDHDSLMRNGAQDLANSEAFQNYYLVSKGIIIKPKKAKVAPAILKAIKYLQKTAKHDSAYESYNLRGEDWFKALAEEHYAAEFEKRKSLRDDFTPAELVKYGPFEEDGSLKYYLYNSLAMEVERYHKKGGQDSAATRGAIAKHFRTDKGSAELQEFANAELEKISSGKQLVKYTKNGNQKRSAYNLDNIVAEMTRELQGGEGFNYGAGSVRSAFAFEFKHNTIESIKSFKGGIVSKEEMDKIRTEANDKLGEALDKLRKFYKYDSSSFGYSNDASSAIAEGPKGQAEAFRMTAESKAIIKELTTYLRELPSEYFETKMQRAVGIGEFKAAIVPKGTSQKVLDILANSGISRIEFYNAKDQAARTKAIAKQKDLLFQPGGKDSNDKRTLESMGVLSDEGLHPDTVADLFGLSSGDELVRKLLTMPDPVAEIERLTDEIMLQRHADLATPEARERAAEAAIHNEAHVKFLATELAALNRLIGKPRLVMAAAKEYANNIVAGTKIKDMNPGQYIAAEAKAGKAAEKAFASGNIQDAALQKRNQVLHAMTVNAVEGAREDIEKAKKFFAKIAMASNKKNVTRGRDPDVVNAINAIIGQYGFYPSKGNSALEYLKIVEQNDPEMFAHLEPAVMRAMTDGKSWRDMTHGEFMGFRESIDGLWYLAKRSREIEIKGNRISLEEAAGALHSRMVEIGIPDSMPGEKGALTSKELIQRKLQAAGSLLRRVEQWAEAKDGKYGGAFLRYIFQPVKIAADNYRHDRVKYRKAFSELLKSLPAMKRQAIEAPELGYTFGAGELKVGLAELLHAVLHTGNESNKRKLLLGRGWAREREDGSLDTGRWDSFLLRMVKEGKLTKEHFSFAQGVWDLLEETKPLAQKTHREVFGHYFAEVTADQFGIQFPDGETITYRGGYVPAQTDTRIVNDAAVRALADQENQNMSFAFPSTSKGFTKSRVEYNKPLLLDIRSLTQHMDKVLLFSHMESPVRDVAKLLKRADVSEALYRIDPTAVDGMLQPWLARSARQAVETPILGDGSISKILSVVRSRAGMALMMGNISNTIQQVTGFSSALTKVKARHIRAGVAAYLSDPKGLTESVASASVFMRDRIENEVSELSEQINEILIDPTLYQKGKAWTQKHAYFLQSALDKAMGPMIWTGAYNQSIEEGFSHDDAVQFANGVIRQTQGTTLPEDISRIETGPAYGRAFTQFIGYFNMLANTNATELKKIQSEIGLRNSRALGVVFFGVLAPAWIAEAIALAFKGGPDDPDDDGYLDDWLSQVIGMGLLKNLIAGVPFVGTFLNVAINNMNKNPSDDRASISPAIGILESGAAAMSLPYHLAAGDNVSAKKAVTDVASLVTVATGLPARPLARPLGYLAGMAQDKINPTGGTDFARGMATGAASPESKTK